MKKQTPRYAHAIPNQIIVFGHPSRIEEMLGESETPGERPGLRPGEKDALPRALRLLTKTSFIFQTPADWEQRLMADLSQPEQRELRLYRLEGDEAQLLDMLLSRRQGFEDVIIERNYLIRAIPWTGGGSPWTGGGSPWTGGGSPWTGGGSPWTAGGSPWTVGSSPWLEMQGQGGAFIRQRAENIFKKQWAFGPEGVNARSILDAQVTGQADGEDVIVGVFDASPFPVPFSSVTLEMPPAPLTLSLSHPIPGGAPGGCGGGLANHGLFVAGLIHALAPAADIQLIRVLDDAAQGNLFTLVSALYQFITDLPAGKRAVINLSLGMHGSDEEGVEDWDGPDLLRKALQRAHEQNIVVVAAAGNENDLSDDDLPSAFPARWEFVVGVAASDSKKKRACFSNQGDVMAPGGAGMKDCKPPAGRCHDEDCPYAVISLDVGSFTGYSYGVGTSFAAPLVAGLAARAQARLEDLATGDLSGPGAASDAVRALILASAATDGVIDVSAV
jgi:hypothetical protein